MEEHNTDKELAFEYVKSGPMPAVSRNDGHRYGKEYFEAPPMKLALWAYLAYAVITLRGHVVDFLRKIGVVKSGRENVDRNVSSLYLKAACKTSIWIDFTLNFYCYNMYYYYFMIPALAEGVTNNNNNNIITEL